VAGPIDVLVATNPVGLRAWFEAADGWGLGDALRGALGAAAVVGRGPRVAQAARAVGLGAAWTPPTDSVTDTIEHLMRAGVSGRRVAVAQHGEPPPDLARALRCAGADVIEVVAFGWTPPRDPRPLEKLVAATSGGHVDVLAFTSAPAATRFLRAADEFGRRDELAHALQQRVLVACIGPVTAEPWRRADLPVVVAGRPRLRTLVREIADRTQHRCGRVVSAAGHRLDVRGHLVVVDTVPIAPGPEAMTLCEALCRHPGQVLSLAELREALPIDPGADRVAAIMATLGTTLGDSRIVQTLGANGYRLAADVDHGTGCRHDGTGT
jgi:uroporphyrinogen-III synthase